MNGITTYYENTPEVLNLFFFFRLRFGFFFRSWSRKKTFLFVIMISSVVLFGVRREELANGPRPLPMSVLNGNAEM